jgi:hypothetical protein
MRVAEADQPAGSSSTALKATPTEIIEAPAPPVAEAEVIRVEAKKAHNPFALGPTHRIRYDAETALQLGLYGIFFCPVLSPVAIFHGVRALRRIKASKEEDDEAHPYRGKAVAGIALGSLGVILPPVALTVLTIWR